MIRILTVTFAASALILASSCAKKEAQEPQTSGSQSGQAQQQQMPAANPHAQPGANDAAGLAWTVPDGWAPGGARSMRINTYLIDAEDPKAECAVFYFGSTQGGDVESNIARWINQVVQPDGSESAAKAKRSTLKTECCEILTVEVPGTYMASSGPMMQVTDERADYILIGGIAPGPEGNVFFKLTGPAAKAEKFRASFETLLKSIRKSS